jgi:membrane-bound lytic murein transglycosylase F
MRGSLTDYFVYRGRPRGFEYDLVQRFAKELDQPLSIEIVTPNHDLDALLASGKIDVWIPGEPLVKPPPRWRAGPTYAHTDTVIVAWRNTTIKKVNTRPQSFALDDLTRWCTPPCQQEISAQNNDWDLLTQLRQIKASDGIAVAVSRRYGEAFARLDGQFEIVHGMGSTRPVSWWLNEDKAYLEPAAYKFFSTRAMRRVRTALTARYFDNPFQMRLRARPWVRSDLAKRITHWDKHLKSAGRWFGVDWRLLAAVMMVESAQDPYATSTVGAQGLFQFMPKTAAAIGLKNPNDPKESSIAAARYLKRLMRRFRNAATPYDQRMMALASYNVGHAHVDDARLLAETMDLNPEHWDDGVGLTLPLLERREFSKEARHGGCQGLVATRYAEQVSNLYDQYSQLLPQNLFDQDGGPETP